MQLTAPFFQLPLRFDAARLAAEVAQFTPAEWRPHPQNLPGNSALPFIARHGNPLDDGLVGPMLPTPYLERCPYVAQVMAALDVPLGRSRLMRLDARAEATAHVDTGYYWQQRVRVHVPIVTFPDVQFICGDASTHMAPGECWIFDTWRVHNVLNPGSAQRIHLVVDTVGSGSFWTKVERGGPPANVPYQADAAAASTLRFEARNYPVVMSPTEITSLWAQWITDAHGGGASAEAIAAIDAAVQPVFRDWRAAWAQFGDRPDGWPHFVALRDRIFAVGNTHADRAPLTNTMDLAGLLKQSLSPALLNTELAEQYFAHGTADAARAAGVIPRMPAPGESAANVPRAIPATASAPHKNPIPAATSPPRAPPASSNAHPSSGAPPTGPGSAVLGIPLSSVLPKLSVQWGVSQFRQQPAAPQAPKPRLERPLIIVSAPRSGSTLLFETLARAKDLYNVGGESHDQFESIAAISPAHQNYRSNRLEAADATPAVVAELHARFWQGLRDRDGQRPSDGASPRLLEKTPKNALRVPFLEATFANAQFVYLYRDPEENVSSMIEGWESGKFVTYPDLPGWQGLPWSFLLVPGWRDLIGAELPAIAAAQWQRTQMALLDDLEALPRARVLALTYREFVAAPGKCIADICHFAGLQWDRQLPPALPLSRHTVTAPHPDKWRQREAVIARHQAGLQYVAGRAHGFIAKNRAPSKQLSVAPT